MRYTLTGLSARTPTVRSRKAGFCLVDDYPIGPALAGKPHNAIFTEPRQLVRGWATRGAVCGSGHLGGLGR